MFCLLLAKVSWPAETGKEVGPRASDALHGELHASLRLRSLLGKAYAEVVLKNTTGEFICVSANVFTTRRGNIQLFDKHGKPIAPDRVSDRFPTLTLGFDFTDSYLILQPGEERSISVDDAPAAVLVADQYGYEITFPYYSCRDVIAKDRVKSKVNVSEFVVHATGKLTAN
jgi:hypothetical protein